MPIEPLSTTAVVGKALWDALAEPLLVGAKDAVKSRWTKFEWQKSEVKYKQRLIELYSTTKLLGNPKPIQVNKIYTDVYVLDQITAYRRLSIDEQSGGLKENTGLPPKVSRKPLLEIVRDRTRVYVLGKPGAGKSTFLRALCLLCCQGEINRTPIMISLKEWNDSRLSVEDFIVDEFKVCGFPDARTFVEQLLSSGLVLLLLDGLDEVPPDQDARQRAITSLTRLARQYPTAQMVLTCRIAAAEYSFDQFDYYEIADFTEEQQTDFVSKWYSGNSLAHEKFVAQWTTSENGGLRDLARTPLLLALLCLAFDETLTFPKRRVELYQEATNALLRKWDATRGIRRDDLYRTLSHIRREQLLARLAARTFLVSKIFFPIGDATQIISEYLTQLPPRDEGRSTDAIDVLKAIEAQHGLLVERAVGIYSFSHLTLHEYFAARFLAESAHQGLLQDTIQSHFFEDSWREIFLMAASIMDDATSLFLGVKTLFENKYFKAPPIIRLFALDCSGVSGRAATSLPTKVEKDTEPSKELLAQLAKAEDLCLSLAANFHFIKCGKSARLRVLKASSQLRAFLLLEAIADPNPVKLVRQINDYFQACNVVIEALQVASLSDRDEIVEGLIFPANVRPVRFQ